MHISFRSLHKHWTCMICRSTAAQAPHLNEPETIIKNFIASRCYASLVCFLLSAKAA